MVVSRDEFSLFKCRRPPLNLKIFISGDAFDDSTFFYQQLKFTWLVRIGIAFEFGGEVDAPSGDPIPLYDTLELIARQAFAVCLACNHCQRICHRSLLYPLPEGNIRSESGILRNSPDGLECAFERGH